MQTQSSVISLDAIADQAASDALIQAAASLVPATVEQPIIVKPARTKRAKPATIKAKAKQAAKPEAVAKPAKPADTERATRVAIVAECLKLAAQHYNGASPSFHRSARPCRRDDYVSRVLNPVQTAKSPSERDESHLATIVTRSKRDATFDPAALCCDLGVISRLASLKLIAYESTADAFSLTTTGAKLARNVAKRLIAQAA